MKPTHVLLVLFTTLITFATVVMAQQPVVTRLPEVAAGMPQPDLYVFLGLALVSAGVALRPRIPKGQ